ncbi:hypothetical protein NEOLEDRAFT_744340 [Neolentinus lepideus HHB14362 ss-1]|uniref:Uncharacterized protein n=1 Tax=Neolentinus lepideus HHB14362 ss-1 TaxID=1314782 RepID=A0A165PXC9_9AGAM|nr:hypothetical protein NEOLEDRAFT_744340 [Neolentinus lepideus HHB14362 ss-1]
MAEVPADSDHTRTPFSPSRRAVTGCAATRSFRSCSALSAGTRVADFLSRYESRQSRKYQCTRTRAQGYRIDCMPLTRWRESLVAPVGKQTHMYKRGRHASEVLFANNPPVPCHASEGTTVLPCLPCIDLQEIFEYGRRWDMFLSVLDEGD